MERIRSMPCEPCVDTEGQVEELSLPEGVPALSSFYLYVTNGCNLACQTREINQKM